MRWLAILAFMCASTLTCVGDPPAHREWASPDGKWLLVCDCKGTWQSDSCSIALSRRSDHKVFFTHHTSDRYIKAVWSSASTRCVFLDAPDNANSYLWLFRVKSRDIATEKLDYEKISAAIEAAAPAVRRYDPAGPGPRSGIDKLEWPSSSQLRLHIIYNNVPVTAALDIAKPQSPKIHVTPDKET